MIAQIALNATFLSYPQITAQAIKQGYTEAARLYDLMQTLARNNNGRSFYGRAELIDLDLLNVQQVDRALRAGVGIFWSREADGSYHMNSRAKVAVALGLEGNPGRAVYLPAVAYQGRLSNFKAWTYAGYLGQLYKQNPPRDKLMEVFGVTLPTLLNWERIAGVKPRPRFVSSDQAELAGTPVEVHDELNRHSGSRKWVTLMGPRGGVTATRRLMDNANEPLADYWSTVEAPAWELNARPVVTWQSSNDYSSTPVPVAPSGRGNWLRGEIRRSSSPDVIGMGGKLDQADDPAPNHPTKPAWQDDEYQAMKYQQRPQNQQKPAIIARYTRSAIQGFWVPSWAAAQGISI